MTMQQETLVTQYYAQVCSSVGGVSSQSILDNFRVVSQELRDGILRGRVGSRVRGQVIGVQTQIQSFNFFYGIQLGVLVLRHTGNSSSNLIHTFRGVTTNSRLDGGRGK